MGTDYERRDDSKPVKRMYMDSWPLRIPIITDPSMPPNTIEIRSGDQRLRVRWPDEAMEIDRWADDGGRHTHVSTPYGTLAPLADGPGDEDRR